MIKPYVSVLTAESFLQKAQQGGKQSLALGGYVTLYASGVLKARFCVKGKRFNVLLGHIDTMSIADARAEAQTLKQSVESGYSVSMARLHDKVRLEHITLEDISASFIDFVKKASSNPATSISIFKLHILPFNRTVRVSKINILQIARDIERARHLKAVPLRIVSEYKKLLKFAAGIHIPINISLLSLSIRDFGLSIHKANRYLRLDEVSEFWSRVKAQDIGRVDQILVLLYLTLGVRKRELLEARKAEFDLARGRWNLPAARTKTRAGVAIALPTQCQALVRELFAYYPHSPMLCPARRITKNSKPNAGVDPSTLNKSLKPILDEMNLSIHGMRHSHAHFLRELKVPSSTIGTMLNHRKGSYDHYDDFKACATARQQLADILFSKLH